MNRHPLLACPLPPPTGSYTSGFTNKPTGLNYASDIKADQQRGIWIDPTAGHTTLGT
jgi:hypothetical protein